jgi:hypothetical protein
MLPDHVKVLCRRGRGATGCTSATCRCGWCAASRSASAGRPPCRCLTAWLSSLLLAACNWDVLGSMSPLLVYTPVQRPRPASCFLAADRSTQLSPGSSVYCLRTWPPVTKCCPARRSPGRRRRERQRSGRRNGRRTPQTRVRFQITSKAGFWNLSASSARRLPVSSVAC